MSDRVAILIPSRDRPEQLFAAVKSILDTSSKVDAFCYVDDDQRAMYEAAMPKMTGSGSLKIAFGPRVGPVPAANALFRIATREEGRHLAYGLFVDDCRFTIPGWDQAVSYEADRSGPVWVMSPAHSRGAFMDFAIISAEWARRLGWIAYPALYQWCWPSVLEALGHATTLVSLPPEMMFVEHPEREPGNRDKSREDFQQFYNFFATNRCQRVLEILKKPAEQLV